MGSVIDRRLEPSDISPEIVKQLDGFIRTGEARLVGPDGQAISLPEPLNDFLLFILDAMKRKQAVLLMPEDEAFTTQAAANFLGMSRPFLLRLLEGGKIPFHRVGTHRRIMFKDLIEFQRVRTKDRNSALSELTRMMEEADVYDRRLEPQD